MPGTNTPTITDRLDDLQQTIDLAKLKAEDLEAYILPARGEPEPEPEEPSEETADGSLTEAIEQYFRLHDDFNAASAAKPDGLSDDEANERGDEIGGVSMAVLRLPVVTGADAIAATEFIRREPRLTGADELSPRQAHLVDELHGWARKVYLESEEPLHLADALLDALHTVGLTAGDLRTTRTVCELVLSINAQVDAVRKLIGHGEPPTRW